MSYHTPLILAQNDPHGNYAAGCPSNSNYNVLECKRCERTY